MKGLELVRNGSVTEAAVLFEDDLKRSEPTEDSWKVVLNTFYRVDNKVAYEINLRRYLKKYSGDAAAWFNLGKLLYDRNELVQAAQAIAGGLKAEPDNVRGNFLLGSIYSDLRLHDDSAT
jgi:tetratricopeptide (TPR) repeat protein